MEIEVMNHSEIFSLSVGIIGLIVGIAGICFAVYQTAVINESKKRKQELQYLIAGISNLALSKTQSWINQTNLISRNTDSSLECARLCVRARDDFTDLHSLATALERTIDSNSSAITTILEQTLKQSKINNQIQEEGLKNPANSKSESNN